MTEQEALHIVRNPWGYSEQERREAANEIADRLEDISRSRSRLAHWLERRGSGMNNKQFTTAQILWWLRHGEPPNEARSRHERRPQVNQQANEQSLGADFDANRAAIYRSLLVAERAKAFKRNGGYLTGAQASAAKANATKKFFALEAAAQA